MRIIDLIFAIHYLLLGHTGVFLGNFYEEKNIFEFVNAQLNLEDLDKIFDQYAELKEYEYKENDWTINWNRNIICLFMFCYKDNNESIYEILHTYTIQTINVFDIDSEKRSTYSSKDRMPLILSKKQVNELDVFGAMSLFFLKNKTQRERMILYLSDINTKLIFELFKDPDKIFTPFKKLPFHILRHILLYLDFSDFEVRLF